MVGKFTRKMGKTLCIVIVSCCNNVLLRWSCLSHLESFEANIVFNMTMNYFQLRVGKVSEFFSLSENEWMKRRTIEYNRNLLFYQCVFGDVKPHIKSIPSCI